MSVRVLQVIPTLDRGGAEKQLTLLATRLPKEEFDVHVCLLTRSGPLLADLHAHEIPVTQIEKSWKIDPLAYWRLRRHIKRLAPDVVHTWIFAANCYGRQAAFNAGVRHVVAGERCVDRWKTWRELAIDRYLARRTERIATNSSGVKEFYVAHGIPEKKFVIIPNGVAPFRLPKNADRGRVLEELGLPENVKLIGAVGRLWPQKRYRDLIWAAELLRVIRDDTHFVIIGDGPLRWRLERFAEQVGMYGRIHFLGERDDVSQWIANFDCFWLGSQYEGQSNALMEAMSAGAPVVATDIAGNRDLVTSEETGYLVPVGDRAGFSRHTNILLNDHSLAARLGAAAKKRMETEFTVEKMVQRHADLYRRLAKR